METTVLIIVMITSFSTAFTASAITLSLPAIGAEFHAGALLLSWVVSAFLLATAALLLPMGRLADIVGRRKIYVAGVFLFTATSAMSAFSWSVEALIAYRILQGLACAMIFSTGIAIVSLVYPPERRGQALGLVSAAVYVGLSLGPVLGGLLNHQLGWRSIFYFTTLFSGFAALMSVWRLKGDWAGSPGEDFDKLGGLGYAVALVSALYGLSEIARVAWAKYALAAGLLLLLLFLRRQTRQEYPLFPVRLFAANPVFAFSNLAAMINYSATYAVGFLLSLYLQVIMGLDSQTAGLVMLSQPVIMALCSPFAGSLSDRVSPTIVASSGMALSTIGLACFIFVTPATSLTLIVLALTLIGLGFALFVPPNNNAIMGSIDKHHYGAAASSLATMRLLGQAASMAVVTLLLSGSAGAGPGYNEQMASQFHMAFIVFTVICGLGIVPSLVRGQVKPAA